MGTCNDDAHHQLRPGDMDATDRILAVLRDISLPSVDSAPGGERAGDAAKPRWLFWAVRRWARRDPAQAENRVEEIAYRIPGHGSGRYLRDLDQPVIGLVRYEFGDWYGPRFPHGSRLVPSRGADWVPDETADRCVMLGSEDPGEPITTAEAEAIIVELGFPIAKLHEPRLGETNR